MLEEVLVDSPCWTPGGAPIEYRKSLGVFYTPQWVAEALVAWALDNNHGPVMDPSYGGCAFLRASLDELRRVKHIDAEKQVFGFDIDPAARDFAAPLVASGIPASNLVHGDFLTAQALTILPMLAAIVGNPPYIRHHAMSAEWVDHAQRLVSNSGATVHRTASAWAYFTILSTAHLRQNGRLALILPGTVLHAHYARNVVLHLQKSFGSLRMLHLRERLFEGTDEESVIVLAARKGGEGTPRYRRVIGAPDLLQAIRDDSDDRDLEDNGGYKLGLISDLAFEAMQELKSALCVERLGNACRVRIGVVTGANDFFVRPVGDSILDLAQVESMPVLTGGGQLTGPTFDVKQMRAIERTGIPCRLAVIKSRGRKNGSLQHQLRSAERKGLSVRHQCHKRRPWYTITDFEPPDLFMPYMGSSAPYLSKNQAGATCTNAIHRLSLREPFRRAVPSVIVSSFTSLFALEAEILGRHYGGGVLKIEPAVATELSVLTEGLGEIYERLVDLRTQGYAIARSDVDGELLNRWRRRISRRAVSAVQLAVEILKNERRRAQASPIKTP
jgi:hypothetical protein